MTPDLQNSPEANPGSLNVGQLIYTSFRENGFTLLSSTDIPSFVQEAFLKSVVQVHWDTYHPPAPGYRAAYLYQLPSPGIGTLFGWLYHDGHDELGRSDIPYFIAYYLPGELQQEQLGPILTALQKGPQGWVDRADYILNDLEPLNITDIQQYQAARKGVIIPTQIRDESYIAFQSQIHLNWFFPDISLTPTISHHPPIVPAMIETQVRQPIHSEALPQEPIESIGTPTQPNDEIKTLESTSSGPNDKTQQLETILRELVLKPIGIQGAALVSAEGQPITTPIGLAEQTATMLAGTMLYLAKSTQQELNWPIIDTVSARSQEGYIILSHCTDETYLLIKSDKVPMGLLEGEVNRTITRLGGTLNPQPGIEPTEIYLPAHVDAPPRMSEAVAEQTVVQVQPITDNKKLPAQSDPNSEVTYRGRRISS